MVRLPNLNVLRFFLAMVVLLGHVARTSNTLGLPSLPDIPILYKGNLAVYFFFCLSGFLIIRQLYLESQKGRLNLLNFYKRRMLRILPLYYLILAAGSIIYFVILPLIGYQTGFKNNVVELFSYYLAFLPNVYISQHASDVGGILYVLWSIGIEIQFYLFIPLIVMAFPKHLVSALLVLVALHVLASNQFPGIAGHYFNFYYFLAGGIISILGVNGKLGFLRLHVVRLILMVLFILLFFTRLVYISNDILFYLFTSMIAGLFICSIADFPIFTIKNRSLNYLGEISYGLYMYHMICITGILYLFKQFRLDESIQQNGLTAVIICVMVILSTIIIAHISYRYTETYFIRKKKAFIS